MTDQIDLVGPGIAADLLDPRQQLLTAYLAGMQRRDRHRKHLRATTAQGRNYPVPVGEKHQADKTEHARHQHQWITCSEFLRHPVSIPEGQAPNPGCTAKVKASPLKMTGARHPSPLRSP